MNECHCIEQLLAAHGITALCETCAAEWNRWCEAQYAEAEGARVYQLETLALRGAAA